MDILNLSVKRGHDGEEEGEEPVRVGQPPTSAALVKTEELPEEGEAKVRRRPGRPVGAKDKKPRRPRGAGGMKDVNRGLFRAAREGGTEGATAMALGSSRVGHPRVLRPMNPPEMHLAGVQAGQGLGTPSFYPEQSVNSQYTPGNYATTPAVEYSVPSSGYYAPVLPTHTPPAMQQGYPTGAPTATNPEPAPQYSFYPNANYPLGISKPATNNFNSFQPGYENSTAPQLGQYYQSQSQLPNTDATWDQHTGVTQPPLLTLPPVDTNIPMSSQHNSYQTPTPANAFIPSHSTQLPEIPSFNLPSNTETFDTSYLGPRDNLPQGISEQYGLDTTIPPSTIPTQSSGPTLLHPASVFSQSSQALPQLPAQKPLQPYPAIFVNPATDNETQNPAPAAMGVHLQSRPGTYQTQHLELLNISTGNRSTRGQQQVTSPRSANTGKTPQSQSQPTSAPQTDDTWFTEAGAHLGFNFFPPLSEESIPPTPTQTRLLNRLVSSLTDEPDEDDEELPERTWLREYNVCQQLLASIQDVVPATIARNGVNCRGIHKSVRSRLGWKRKYHQDVSNSIFEGLVKQCTREGEIDWKSFFGLAALS